ncbi:Crp/Fnr family transcriptional regulator [Vibrio renipiscarius]|uniref:Cyclic nucleotide-binding domain-containing protein n=1 Tax=Vibrio renipiscarius TaxID=1461322 RepID=A0A0C2NEQ8_9VIBR|nr:Crp/Fnr family transcriptional regulator [Vibrio renipiscarius]KII76397.1 hypothetical protein OJ16_16520 [Vibrio renipiscarius]KII78081.1 hypothetical protein PL18_14050 [Vibrio renipiscarius]
MLTIEQDIYHSGDILRYLQDHDSVLSLRKVKISRGEQILRQNETIEDVIFIVEGEIRLSRVSDNGRCYQLGSYLHNGFLGLMELFSQKPGFYSVVAESDCEAYVFKGRSFHQLVCCSPPLAAITFRHLTSKWYLSVERMTRNILHTIKYCVIDDLMKFHQANGPAPYLINKSLECERLGTSLRVYNRILKELSSCRAIQVDRKSIVILDMDVLRDKRNEEAQK